MTIALQGNRVFPDQFYSFLSNPGKTLKTLAWRFPKMPSTKRHLFIVGAPRSGTTLLEAILAVHPNFSSLRRELAIFSFRNIFELERLTFAITEMETSRALFEASGDIVEFYDAVAERTVETYGGERFLEKTPQNVFHLAFLRNSFPNAQFVNIFRDGRDCFCSARKNPYVIQSNSVENYAQYWRRCVESRIALGEDPNIIDIRYEELTSQPEQVLRTLMGFLGEEFFPEQLQENHYSQHGASQISCFKKLCGPIDTTSHDQWRTELSKQEIQRFEKVAGSQLTQLGYSPPTASSDKRSHLDWSKVQIRLS